jgi:hypothetical protein
MAYFRSFFATQTLNFNAPVNCTLQSGSQAVAVAVGDLRGNGINDVVAASTFTDSNGSFGGTVDVALGNGDGTLGGQNSYSLGGPVARPALRRSM